MYASGLSVLCFLLGSLGAMWPWALGAEPTGPPPQARAGFSIPVSPTLSEPADGTLVPMADVHYYSSQETGITFRWSGVIGASGYDLEIQRPVPDDGPFPPETWPIVLSATGPERFISRLPITYSDPAHYDTYPWRVRARDGEGSPGPYSTPFHFTVVRHIPTPTPPSVSDVNDDGFIDHKDTFSVSGHWWEVVSPSDIHVVRLDLVRDGMINKQDLLRYLEGHRSRGATQVAVPVIHQPTPESQVSRWEYLVALVEEIPFFIWNPLGEGYTYDLEIEGFTQYSESNGPFLEYDLVGVPVDHEGSLFWGIPPTRSLREGMYRVRLRGRSPLGRASPFSDWVFFELVLQ
jgi:hypothetical protein